MSVLVPHQERLGETGVAGERYEIRDPLHGFVRFNTLERDLINAPPFQRLKWIKQLAMSYEVYPGAVHTRFEHSLGAMELAGRLFDTLVAKASGAVRERLGWRDQREVQRQRQLVRLAALLHDVGHAPFSHGSEDLLPAGHHEQMTERVIRETEVREIIERAQASTGIGVDDVVPVALGPRQSQHRFTESELVLAEILTGELGVDRIDYLNRDSLHAGVAYGRFDYPRLLDTLAVGLLPDQHSPTLAVEEGGLHAAEGLLLARYFMFQQVSLHHVRVIYDLHLRDFLRSWLPGGVFPADVSAYLSLNDAHVHAAIDHAQRDPTSPQHLEAVRLTNRRHFRRAGEIRGHQRAHAPRAFEELRALVRERLGEDRARLVRFHEALIAPPAVPIWLEAAGQYLDLRQVSDVFRSLPESYLGRVFADRAIVDEVARVVQGVTERLGV